VDPNDTFDLQGLADAVADVVELVPVEVFPVAPVPVRHAVGWLARLIVFFSRHAILLAGFGAYVENTAVLGFLLPGGTVVALSGAGGRAAGISLPALVLAGTLGMTGGAVTNYFLGRAGAHQILNRRWTGKIGRDLAHQLQGAEPLLRRHGWWVMLIAHAFGPGRSSLGLAAGASGFSLSQFLVIEIPAALLWSALYAGGGYLLASQWQDLELLLRRIGWAGAGLLVIGAAAWWLSRRLRHAGAPDQSGSGIWTNESVTPSRAANGRLAPDAVVSTVAGRDTSPSTVVGAGRRRSARP